MTDATTTPTDKAGSEFSQYRRSQIAELRPYVPGEPAELLYRVSISQADLDGGSPKDGDMIARSPANHEDQWLVAADYFAANFEPLYPHPQPSLSVGLDREAVARVIASPLCDATKSDHEIEVREGGYKFCRACGETIRKAPITLFEARKAADAILALAAPAEGWQGIETLTDVHRDGRFILAFVGNADGRWEHLNGRVFAIKHQGKTSSDFDLGWSLYPGLGGISDSWFTAWKPLDLPAAPTGETGA